jgi:hypothetical protein
LKIIYETKEIKIDKKPQVNGSSLPFPQTDPATGAEGVTAKINQLEFQMKRRTKNV